jgi:hypothetical protein
MKTSLSIVCRLIGLSLSALGMTETTIPLMPNGESPSSQYKVFLNDKEIPVWTAKCNKTELGNTYSFTYFDMTGTVDIRLVTAEPFKEVVIRPQDYGIESHIAEKQISFHLDQPRKISIEPFGMKNVLLLFANPPQTSVPDKADKKVIYFDPGIHRVPGDVIQLTSGQTLYLAPGAILKAAVFAADANDVHITGRGMIDGTDWPWLKGPRGYLLGLERCRDVSVDGIILRGSYGWTLVPRECENVSITNIKIVNDRVQNDDGINPCNSKHVTVHDCFIRTDDDCMSIKGLKDGRQWPSEDITIENMVFWCSRARIILFAHESQAQVMRHIRVLDSWIIHYTMTPFLMEPGEEMPLSDIVIDGIHINAVGKGEIARLRPCINQYMVIQKPGHIDNIHFKNLDIATDNPASVFFYLQGADANHAVKQVSFDNIRLNGKPAENISSMLQMHPFVFGVTINGKEQN